MFRRLLAVFLALWLPLQLGTAFAVSAPMQASSGGEFSHATAMAMAHAKVDTTKVDAIHASHASHDCAGQASDCHAMPAHDPATCLKCAFCFASAVAFIGMPDLVSVHVVNTAPASMIVATFDSVALIPPDPPPIA